MMEQLGAARNKARQPAGALGYGILMLVSGFAVIWLIASIVTILAAWRKQKRRERKR
jgi:hypothetical protein